MVAAELGPTDVTLGEVYRGLLRLDHSVSELSSTLGTAQNTLLERLDTKADKSDLARIEGRLDAHDTQLASLQQRDHDDQVARTAEDRLDGRRLTRRQKIGAAIFAALTLTAMIVGPVLAAVIASH